MEGRKIIQLNRAQYSKLLKDFYNIFINDFPEHFDTWEILDFSIEVWNISNMRKIIPEKDFLEATTLSEEMDETSQLFEKMVDYKMKHYSQFDKFIIDYVLDDEVDPIKLEVISGDIDDYKELLGASEFEEEEGIEENLTNRDAIILKPKKVFVDWVLKVDEDNDDETFIIDTKIYLIDGEEIDSDEWLEENYNDLFESQLNFWCSNPDQWPQNRTISEFKKWFEIDFSMMVYDLKK